MNVAQGIIVFPSEDISPARHSLRSKQCAGADDFHHTISGTRPREACLCKARVPHNHFGMNPWACFRHTTGNKPPGKGPVPPPVAS